VVAETADRGREKCITEQDHPMPRWIIDVTENAQCKNVNDHIDGVPGNG